MSKTILIDAAPWETRVAVLEDTALGELYVERGRDRSVAGNVYKGSVVRVLPGMQAAFVDVGLEKAAFLHVSDLTGPDLRCGDLRQLQPLEPTGFPNHDRAHGREYNVIPP